jgi:hypothetical protein
MAQVRWSMVRQLLRAQGHQAFLDPVSATGAGASSGGSLVSLGSSPAAAAGGWNSFFSALTNIRKLKDRVQDASEVLSSRSTLAKPNQPIRRQLKRTLSTGDLQDPSEGTRQLSVLRSKGHVALQIEASRTRVAPLVDADASSGAVGKRSGVHPRWLD